MAQTRRMGVEGSTRRTVLMDAAEAILREDGYIEISARNVAGRAGLTKQLLYYYFQTMDDLILAVVRRVNERRHARFADALAAPDPLRALWALNSDPSGAALATELTAIASHREAVRAEIVASARAFRTMQVQAVTRLLVARGHDGAAAAGLVMIAAGLSRSLTAEAALGLTEGHDEALAIVERMLAGFAPHAD